MKKITRIAKIFFLYAVLLMLWSDSIGQTIAAGGSNAFSICNNNTVRGWGSNFAGLLGNGTNVDSNVPVQVSGLTGIVAVSAAFSHTLFLKSDGTVWGCGSNNSGELGDGTVANQYTPVQAAGLTGIIAIAAGGGHHSHFLKNDGTVWACGDNQFGQLGDGTTTQRVLPVQITSLTNVIAIAGGVWHTLFLKNDGTVWACGSNTGGQLGDGTTTQRNTPVEVSGLSGIIRIAAFNHSMFLKNDGTAWACGFNYSGQLGDGTTTYRNIPVHVSGSNGIVAFGCGQEHSLFIKTDGTVWACGYNGHGEIGDGTTIQRTSPVQANGLSGISSVTGGSGFSCVLKNDGTLYTWGANSQGQLGNGNNSDNMVPTQLTGLCQVLNSAVITASGSPNFCVSGSVTLFASVGAGISYQWRLNGNNIIGATTSSYTTVTAGNYDCTITNSSGSTVSNSIVVTISNGPPPLATIIASGPTTFCSPGSVTLIASASSGLSYQWRMNGTPIAGATASLRTFSAAGLYDCIISNACGSTTSNSISVTVNFLPPASISTSSTTICTPPGSLTLFANTGAGLTYQWRRNNVDILGATSSSFSATTSGTYYCVVTNLCGSTNSNQIFLTNNIAPTVSITANGPTTICPQTNVVLQAAATGSALSYQWKIGTTNIPGATSITYTASAPGSYTCRVTNTCGAATSNAITVSLLPVPPTTIAALGPTTFCSPGNVTLAVTNMPGLTYQWYRNGFPTDIFDTTYITGATSGGTYYCRLYNGTCYVYSDSITVTVTTPPAISIAAAGPTAFCNTVGPVTFNATPASGLSYQWTLNSSDIPGATSSSYTATAAGTYTCVGSDINCSNTSNAISVTVASSAPAPAITAGGPTTFCASTSVALTVNTCATCTYQWRKDGINITGATSTTRFVNVSGNYDCVVTNGCGSVASNVIAITVNPLPPGTITAAGSTAFCAPGSVTLNASIISGLTYQWRLNGFPIAGATSSSYVAAGTGNYSCTVGNSCGNVISNTIAVNANAAPPATIVAAGPTTFCTPGVVTLNANTGTGLTYQWRLNGGVIPAATSSFYVAGLTGNYDCIVANVCGSTTSNIIAVTVNSAPPANITAGGPTTFCSPGTVTLNANTGAGLSYQWSREAVNISGATLSSYSAALSGSYICAVTNVCGSAASNAVVVTVNHIPATPGAIAGQATGVCSLTTTYSIGLVPGATGYIWTVPSGATINSGQGTATISVAFTSSFSSGLITVVATNTCGTSNASFVNATSVPALPGNITGPVSVCHNQNNVLYSIALVAGATSYIWAVPVGAQIKHGQGTEQIRVRFGNSAGNITVRANNACGQGAIRTLAITMPCRDGEEISSDDFDITLYPNPAADKLSVFCNRLAGNESLLIFNAVGEIIFKSEIRNPKSEIDIHSLPDGMYFAEIISGEQKKIVKFIKQE